MTSLFFHSIDGQTSPHSPCPTLFLHLWLGCYFWSSDKGQLLSGFCILPFHLQKLQGLQFSCLVLLGHVRPVVLGQDAQDILKSLTVLVDVVILDHDREDGRH